MHVVCEFGIYINSNFTMIKLVRMVWYDLQTMLLQFLQFLYIIFNLGVMRLRMLAKIVFEKINFSKQFQIHNIFHIKDHQKTT